MGEWSDYFEDHPEENPTNPVDGRFDPKEAAHRRALAKGDLVAIVLQNARNGPKGRIAQEVGSDANVLAEQERKLLRVASSLLEASY